MSKKNNQYKNKTRGELKESAKKLLAGHWNKMALMVFIYFAITFGAGIIDAIFMSLIVNVLTTLLLLPLIVGLMAIYKNFSEGKTVEISNLFDYYKDLRFVVKIVFASIVTGLAVLVGLVVFIIPGIIIALGLSQFMWVMLNDKEIGTMDALKRSWELMNGYKLEYFVLNLSFIGWGILAGFTLGIGFLWLMPYMYVTYYLFYLKLKAS